MTPSRNKGCRLIDIAESGPSRYMWTNRAAGNCVSSSGRNRNDAPERSTTTSRPDENAHQEKSRRY
ncbi:MULTISPECIES: hypothetical protein [Streptomyces]|uniref:hypothetical protein n=1 Tax=Streptomyces TaxID=1883 RepID=UPI0023B18A60|nr:hypothetical protein [Streptomyces sp. KA12]MDF0375980.1 hypothetical protein [Streptomyces sp. KA12]